MKKLQLFALLLALGATATAQHFEWAKGYGSDANTGNHIVGTVADPEGNLYILGNFFPDAEWDGVPLLPMTPYGPNFNTRSVVVAKISPSGEMLWKKVIHGNGNNDAFAYDIKALGDTAIAFLAQYNTPLQSQNEYLYYLDTLYTSEENFVHNLSGMSVKYTTAFIVLDLDGNVLEDHAINMTFVDRYGADVTYEYTSAFGPQVEYENDVLRNPSFDVDKKGNVYICRWANDTISSYGEQGYDLLSAVKVWVDNHVVGVVERPLGTRCWFPQLIKFSPHLDTVIGSRYLVQKGPSGIPYTENLVKCRQNGDVYVIWNIPDTRRLTDTIVCDFGLGIWFRLMEQYAETGYLCKYDSVLNQKWGITIDRDSILNPAYPTSISWNDICFDDDSDLFFLCSKDFYNTYNEDTSNFFTVCTYNGTPLPIQRNSMLVLSFREQEHGIPELVKCGRFPSKYSAYSKSVHLYPKGNMACHGNRLFIQAISEGGFVFPSETIDFEFATSDYSLGLAILDYQMNVICGFDLNSHSTNSDCGPVIITDSILYITNYVATAHAQFDNITFQGDISKNYAVIAKYVDTAFMTPYVYTGDTGDVRIVLAENESWFAAYPNPFRQRVKIKVESGKLLEHNGIVTAILTDLSGRREEVRLTPDGPNRYTLDLTSRSQSTYLLTLTTADGRQRTLRLLKQSDMFGD